MKEKVKSLLEVMPGKKVKRTPEEMSAIMAQLSPEAAAPDVIKYVEGHAVVPDEHITEFEKVKPDLKAHQKVVDENARKAQADSERRAKVEALLADDAKMDKLLKLLEA